MPKQDIVIVTNEYDPHSDRVILALRELGYTAIRLNTEDIPIAITSTVQLSNKDWASTIRLERNERIIDINNTRSIWWRRPSQLSVPSNFNEQEQSFAQAETNHFLQGLWGILDCYWISYPAHIRQASWKLEQLKRAAKFGFRVPHTMITNDPEQAREFYDTCDGKVVYKVMSDPSKLNQVDIDETQNIKRIRSVLTTLVTEQEISMLESVRYVPCLFQELIPKKVELRVTIIGDDVFVAAIHSQDNPLTSIDWRNHEAQIPYEVASLPPDITTRCLELVKSYSLNFSAMDLILTPDDEYVFLENNPNGQFMFIQDKVPELKMTEALMACLIRGGNA